MTQAEVAQAIVRQLRLVDPSVSAEIGTPERKIIDVVAQQVAERSIDLNQLRGALDIEAKYGTDLDNFLSLFRFGRQQGTFASSFVTFSRPTPSTYDIFIPSGTVVVANTSSNNDQVNNVSADAITSVYFRTTNSVTLPAGQLSIIAPVTATRVGTVGNVAVGEIRGFGSNPIAGITDVTNEIVGRGGVNPETDDELKARFKNTVFRNVSGTHDQFLADALRVQFTTKANVVGPISKYIETIKVPEAPDSEDGSGVGNPDEWTSALSSIPYSKYIYQDLPHYVIDDQMESPYFFRQGIDYEMNSTSLSKNKGDAYRQRSVLNNFGFPIPSSVSRPNITFKAVLSEDAANSIYGLRPGKVVQFEHSYMSESSRNDYENGVLNCVDVFINGINEEYADVILPIPSMSDAFIINPASIRHYDNYRRYGEPTHRPVVGNLFQPLFSQPSTRLPETITVGDSTFLNGVHYFAVEDVTELRGTVRARNGIEWNPTLPGKLPSDDIGGPFTGSTIVTLGTIENFLEVENRILRVNNYSYNSSVSELQNTLERNKQVTTDVLGHAAIMRYFKVDIAVMYAIGASENNVNANISRALAEHFNSLYFGNYIQLSDILQVIRQVPGIDNVRWSIDVLREDPNFNGDFRVPLDSQGRARWPITECDMRGRPLTRVISERVQQNRQEEVSDWNSETEYQPLEKVKHNGSFWIAINQNSNSEPGESSIWRQGIEEGTKCIDRVYLTGEPTGGTFVLSYKLFNAGIVEYADSPNVITGFGPPNNDIGNVGDNYYDKQAEMFYEGKTAAGWPTNPTRLASNETIDMTFSFNASAESIEERLRTQLGDFQNNKTSLRVTGEGTPSNPWEIRWEYIEETAPGPLYAVSSLWGQYSWDSDFALKDDELPTITLETTNLDTGAGFTVMVKTQNTWDQS